MSLRRLNREPRPQSQKGTPFRHVITIMINGEERELHVTKGWRKRIA